MPTYADYAAAKERTERRALQDRAMRREQALLDGLSQNLYHKHDRPHFAVVGEGSRSANDAYQRGYALIDWGKG